MPSSPVHPGITIRPDGVPLRTKIVCTISTPEMYAQEGAVDLDETEISPANLNYDYIVGRLYEQGVDVIRINLSHVAAADAASLFLDVKRAVLGSERKSGSRRRMAVLVDLPGPKIRFRFGDTPIPVNLGDRVDIHFSEVHHERLQQTVFVDKHPLKKAIDDADEEWRRQSACAVSVTPELALNVIACDAGLADRYQRLMEEVDSRLSRGVPVRAYVGDGEVVAQVRSLDHERALLRCEVVSKKVDAIRGNRGFTLKGIDIDVPAFTGTDRALLQSLLEADHRTSPRDDEAGSHTEPVLALVGLSFSQTADDVLRARMFMEGVLSGLGVKSVRRFSPSIIAKIETAKGWQNREYILDIADGIMVARGDLGIQMEVEEVPRIQKLLIELCRKRGKPVITATEMLKSMTASIEPTRAEVSDVFNAIEDGTDAIMTSEETARGRFPFHTVRKMVRIATRAELHCEYYDRKLEHGQPANAEEEKKRKAHEERKRYRIRQKLVDFLNDDFERITTSEHRLSVAGQALNDQAGVARNVGNEEEYQKLEWRRILYQEKQANAANQESTNRISQAACTLTETTGTEAIVATTASGRTARMISRLQPSVPIIGAAHDTLNTRKLVINYGVFPICIGEVTEDQSADYMFELVKKTIAEHPYLKTLLSKPCTVIYTAGTPLNIPGKTNLVQIRDLYR